MPRDKRSRRRRRRIASLANIDADKLPRLFSLRYLVPAGARTAVLRMTPGASLQISSLDVVVNHLDPLIKAQLAAHWDLNANVAGLPNPANLQSLLTGNLQFVQVANIQINVPEAIRQWAQDAIVMAQAFTSILNDPFAALRKPIATSGLMHTILGDTTLLDLLPVDKRANMDDFLGMLDAIGGLGTTPTQVGALYIDGGSYKFVMNGYNPLNPTTNTNKPDMITICQPGQFSCVTPPDTQQAFTQSVPDLAFRLNSIKSADGGGLAIDLLKQPTSIMRLLLDRPTTIIDYQTPPIDYTLTFNRAFSLKPWNFLPFFGNRLSGEVRIRGVFTVGDDNVDGAFVYVDPNLTELTIDGTVTVDAARLRYGIDVDLGFTDINIGVEVGLRGGIEALATINMRDQDGDGRLTMDEFEQRPAISAECRAGRPLCLCERAKPRQEAGAWEEGRHGIGHLLQGRYQGGNQRHH